MMCENTKQKKDILVIIPAYNEADNIEKVMSELDGCLSFVDYVIVNDGSKDKTADICRKRQFNMIDLPVNLGLAGAFQTGMRYAYKNDYSYAIQFDADGQHRPEYIQSLYEEIKKGYDIVIGSRFVDKKKNHSLRMFGNNMISGAIRLTTGKKIKDSTSGMRMFNREMIREFALNLNYGPEPDTLSHLLRSGIKLSEVQVEMAERMAGESYLNFTKSIMYMLRMMISILLVQNFRKHT